MRAAGRASACLLLLAVAAACRPAIDERGLVGLAAEAQPAWPSYQEDIKGMIGATPVAEWEGVPVRAWRDAATVRVQFQLRGPWRQREAAVPILMRDAVGSIRRSVNGVRQDDSCVYVFDVPEWTAASATWFELKYPHAEKRIVLGAQGTWQAPS